MRDGNRNEHRNEPSGSSLVAQPQHLLNNKVWQAYSAKFEQLQKDYVEEYENVTRELCEISDMVLEIRTKRTEDVRALSDQHQEWVGVVKQVQKTANDTTALELRRKEIEEFESEKQHLLGELIRGNEENEEIGQKFSELEASKQQLRKLDQAARQKERQEVPTLEFMLRVLKTMSRSYLSEKTEKNVIEGFTIQEEENDMRPFRFDDETPLFERVNYVWEPILQRIETETPHEKN